MDITARKELQSVLSSMIPCFLSLNQTINALAYVEHNKGRELSFYLPKYIAKKRSKKKKNQ